MYTLQLDRCMCTILTRHASINQIKSHWKTSEGEKQAYICCMFVEGKSKTVFFPSDTLIYGICRDGTKNNNIRACEHLILGQFRMGARSAIYAPLDLRFPSYKCLKKDIFSRYILTPTKFNCTLGHAQILEQIPKKSPNFF